MDINIGKTIVPTIITEPSPLTDVKINAVAKVNTMAKTIGLSPQNSEDTLTMAEDIPVLLIT